MTPYYLLMPREGYGVVIPDPSQADYVRRVLARSLRCGAWIAGAEDVVWTRDRDSPAPDWLRGGFGVPLLSQAFREVIDSHLTEADRIEWLSTTLIDSAESKSTRWIPHIPGPRDILDTARTEWGPSGLPTAWVLSAEKMKGIAVTARPQTSGSLIVNADIMRALRRAKLDGFAVMHARVADVDTSQ